MFFVFSLNPPFIMLFLFRGPNPTFNDDRVTLSRVFNKQTRVTHSNTRRNNATQHVAFFLFVAYSQAPFMKMHPAHDLRRLQMTTTPTITPTIISQMQRQNRLTTWTMATMAARNSTWAILICRAFVSPRKTWRHCPTSRRPFQSTARTNC